MKKIIMILVLAFLIGMNAKSQTAYIPCYGTGGGIYVINIATNTVIDSIPNLVETAVAISPDGSKAYFLGDVDGKIHVINTATNTVSSIITVPTGSWDVGGIAISPDGNTAYITSTVNYSLIVLNLVTETVIDVIYFFPNIAPVGVCVSPDGSKVYVNRGYIMVINTTINSVIDSIMINGSNNIGGICTTPDGNWIYAAGSVVGKINAVSDTLVNYFGTSTYGLCISLDGTKLYCALSSINSVQVIDVATDTGIALIPVGHHPMGISITPDGSKVLVANELDNNVSVINTATYTVTDSIRVGHNPIALGNFISSSTVGIPSITNPSTTLTITPNPSNGIFLIRNNSQFSTLNSQLTIYDVLGNIIYQKSNIKENSLTVDLSAQAWGVYFVKMIEENKVTVQKIIVE